MAKPKREGPTQKRPRQEHPFLVGHTEREARLVMRAAKAMGLGPIAFLRESGQYQAREALGLEHPTGEG